MTRLEESHSFTDSKIHVPDGFRASNKCRWPLIAAARADVEEGTALRAAVGRGIAVARLPARMSHAGANAYGTDRWTRISINLYLCFSVLMNLAQAAGPEYIALDCGYS